MGGKSMILEGILAGSSASLALPFTQNRLAPMSGSFGQNNGMQPAAFSCAQKFRSFRKQLGFNRDWRNEIQLLAILVSHFSSSWGSQSKHGPRVMSSGNRQSPSVTTPAGAGMCFDILRPPKLDVDI